MPGALEQLERVAARVRWRLVWKVEQLVAHPTLTLTTLDIFEDRRLVTADGAVWAIHGRDDPGARAHIADRVLSALPRGGGSSDKGTARPSA